jgi:hypothetical protein
MPESKSRSSKSQDKKNISKSIVSTDDSDKSSSSQFKLKQMIKTYLEEIKKGNVSNELEVRFGTKGFKRITKIDYDNVIKKLLSLGFKQNDSESYLLRCQSEYIDSKTGVTKISNVRTEIEGLHSIQELCKTNSIEKLIPYDAKFTQKTYHKDIEKNQMFPVDFEDFNFRVALNTETSISETSPMAREMISKWNDTKKIFRFINRVSFVDTRHDIPIKVDLSIVKESHRRGKHMIPEYTINEAEVFDDIPKYEIELEALNSLSGSSQLTVDVFEKKMKTLIKWIMSGLQQTNYPISYTEQNKVIHQYLKLIKKDEYKPESRPYPKDFIGPSSYTLQMHNITQTNQDSIVPNIRNNYTVTDKADGDRKLLFINDENKIYLIDTNMNVQFTGAVTDNDKLKNTLVDGEHILHNKNKQFINLYAAFDVYFINGEDKRSLGFVPQSMDDVMSNFRLSLLSSLMKQLNAKSIIKSETVCPIRISNKIFYAASDIQTIFQCCGQILQKENDGLFEYNTDGLIFTPTDKGVGSDTVGAPAKNTKTTWDYSFKWKPPQFNTIDFLVTTKKNASGQEMISSLFNSGINVNYADQIKQYKTLVLCVGFDEKKHGYINPCNDIYEDKLPNPDNIDNEDSYKPLPFYPTNPYDIGASLCNIMLKDDMFGNKKMMTQDNEVIEDNMIVEFYYDTTKEKEWRWTPLRVRYDKTSELRAGLKNYGNAYHVANSNWHTIHNPITNDMIQTGLNIPEELGDDDVYYNRTTGVSKTRGLRDFHNLFVKKMLIMGVSQRGNTLIDYAVGKAGDLPKWIASYLSFVFGVDVSRDNIENRLDGACARYLNYRKKFKSMPNALFVHGNSSVNIKNGEALYTERAKQITKALFGEGPKDEKTLGKGVFKQYGKGVDGFNVSSIQFALHYMFESNVTLQNFLRNVSECTKVNGYFIGTSYDGESMFKMLENKETGESVSIYEGDNKIWEVRKMYNNTSFDDDESSLGYPIDVYQETINKVFREYLVNYNYLTRLMENYGFVLLTKDETNRLGFPSSTGMFNELYTSMENEIKRDKMKESEYGVALKMTAGERKISFLNRYFIYKKVRNVDAEAVAIGLLNVSKEEEKMIENENEKLAKTVAKEVAPKHKAKKLKLKLKLTSE